MPRNEDTQRVRLLLAQEAARIISEQGIQDYRQAKLKAAERLNVQGRGALPGNTEIEQALLAHQSLFGRDEHADFLKTLRHVALSAMELLDNYSPRLVGPVLSGTADTNSPVLLHAFSDNPEDVLFSLEGSGHTVSSYQRRLRSNRNIATSWPGYAFELESTPVETTVFPFDGLRQAPISPIDGRPMQRASAKVVQRLLSKNQEQRLEN